MGLGMILPMPTGTRRLMANQWMIPVVFFGDYFVTCVHKHVPTRKAKKNPQKPWIRVETINLARRKRRLVVVKLSIALINGTNADNVHCKISGVGI